MDTAATVSGSDKLLDALVGVARVAGLEDGAVDVKGDGVGEAQESDLGGGFDRSATDHHGTGRDEFEGGRGLCHRAGEAERHLVVEANGAGGQIDLSKGAAKDGEGIFVLLPLKRKGGGGLGEARKKFGEVVALEGGADDERRRGPGQDVSEEALGLAPVRAGEVEERGARGQNDGVQAVLVHQLAGAVVTSGTLLGSDGTDVGAAVAKTEDGRGKCGGRCRRSLGVLRPERKGGNCRSGGENKAASRNHGPIVRVQVCEGVARRESMRERDDAVGQLRRRRIVHQGESVAEQITLKQWVSEQTDPALGAVFLAIAAAAVQIAGKIRLAGLDDAYGAAGATNVQGEQQQKLDVFANEVMIAGMRACEHVIGLVSEEDEEPVEFAREEAQSGSRHLVVCFDPLDGSSNIDVNVNVGTIFGVRSAQKGEDLKRSVLRPGREQIAAGYVVYGPSVVFVLTTGERVDAFTMTDNGEFLQSSTDLRMPEQGPYYSANEANGASWPEGFREYLQALLDGELGDKAYSARYIGSLVADFHRTLLKGGVFLYPPAAKAPEGKLRLQYEANPLALLAEAAGGAAVNGSERILDIAGKGIHSRTPLVVGSRREVEFLQRFMQGASA